MQRNRDTQRAIIDSLKTPVLTVRVRREIARLPSILGEDELPETFVYGVLNDGAFTKLYGKRDLERLIVATDKRLLLVPHLRASALEPEVIEYAAISEVRDRGGSAAGLVVRASLIGVTGGLSGLAKASHPSVAIRVEGEWITMAQIQPLNRIRQLADAIRAGIAHQQDSSSA
jgi:hypothetical protein